jgi:uncharacterized protein (DUF608 family)
MGRLSTPTWLQTLWDGSDRRSYLDADLRCIAMPLGGIGTGHLCICGDGSLRQWQISNNIQHVAYVPFGFFALRVEESWSKQAARILMTDDFWNEPSYEPAPLVSDHFVPFEHQRAFAGFPLVEGTRFTGEYPVAQIEYSLGDWPVACELTAWSPLVPFDSESSGMPVAIFDFEIRSRAPRPISVSLLGSLQNLVGWDGRSPIRGVSNQSYGNNVNRSSRVGAMSSIEMFNLGLTRDHPHNGELVLGCDGKNVTACAQWNSLPALWEDFFADGKIEPSAIDTPSLAMTTWNGSLCEKRSIEPGERMRVRFVYAWRFPNRYVDFAQKEEIVPRDHSRFYLGNEYAKRFPTATAVIKQLQSRPNLDEETMAYRSAFYDSNLPYHLIDAISANSSTFRTSICMRTEDGHFYGFEGGCGASAGGIFAAGGCCPMNCTHVWNYDQTLAHLFPDLHLKMREVDWLENQHESGYLPHRVALPLYLKRLWDMPIGGPTNPAVDGLFAGILKTYQQWCMTSGSDIDELLVHARAAISYAMEKYDDQGDGMIRGEQPNTYDIHLYGPNTFIGTMYLASLLACERMFPDLADECRRRFDSGTKLYDETCWNGEFYRQVVEMDRYEHQFGDGCVSDQLLGQWWAHVCGLGYVLPKERVRAALQSIFTRNFRENFVGVVQTPRQFAMENDRGLLNATYVEGQRPTVPLLYSDEVWSGVEYALASLMIYEGMTDQALQIVKAARDRYSGSHRNPFNEIECGDHYVRPLSAYSLLLAATGVHVDLRSKQLRFAPNWPQEHLRAFFTFVKGYGTVDIAKQEDNLVVTIEVRSGSLDVSETLLLIESGRYKKALATVDNSPLRVVVKNEACIVSGFSGPITGTVKVVAS